MERLAYLAKDVDRRGNERWYLRMKGRPKQRIREVYGTPEFEKAYWRARKGLLPSKRDKAAAAPKLKAPRRIPGCARPGHVYFIEALGLNRLKIGYSHNPKSRLSDLQVASPVKLALILGITNGDDELERAIHQRFAEFRTAGEWFVFADPIRKFLSDVKRHRYPALAMHGIEWTKPMDPA